MASSELISRARKMLGDDDPDPANWIWETAQVGEFIDQGFSEYTYGVRDSSSTDPDDVTQGMKLARSYALYELATNTALFFKWRDSNQDVDRSMTPEMARRIGKDLWEQVMKHREEKGKSVGVEGKSKPQGGMMTFSPGDRTQGRAW